MSDDYTPTSQEVREGYAWWHEYQEDGAAGIPVPESEAAFDRWLESVRAEERERIARNIQAAGREEERKDFTPHSGGRFEGLMDAARIAREGA